MSKDMKGSTIIVNLYNVERFESFVGKTMSLIETLGLQSKQEEAFKKIIKQEIWDLWDSPWGVEEKVPFLDAIDENSIV